MPATPEGIAGRPPRKAAGFVPRKGIAQKATPIARFEHAVERVSRQTTILIAPTEFLKTRSAVELDWRCRQ
jgi:hypothetical protein